MTAEQRAEVAAAQAPETAPESSVADAAPDAPAAPEEAPNPLLQSREYQFPAETVDARVRAILQQRGKNARIKGFRPGKAPLSILQRMFGKETCQSVLQEMTEKQFNADAETEKLRIATYIGVSPNPVAGENGYQATCHYEMMPEVAAPDFSGQRVNNPTCEVGAAEVEEMIQILRRQSGHYHDTDHAATAAHRVIFDYTTTDNESGDTVDSGDGRHLDLEREEAPAEIRTALTGAKAGDSRAATLPLPDTHPRKESRGRMVTMTMQVRAVQELHLAELNDEFFARFGVEEGGQDAFREMVDKHLQSEVAVRLRNLSNRRLLDVLIAATPEFPLPAGLVYREAEMLKRNAVAQYEQQGMKEYTQFFTPRMFAPEARHRVRLGLIMAAWKQRENPTFSDEEVNARLNDIAESYEEPEKKKAEMRAQPQQMETVYLSLLEDHITRHILNTVDKEDQPVPFQDLLNDRHAGAAA